MGERRTRWLTDSPWAFALAFVVLGCGDSERHAGSHATGGGESSSGGASGSGAATSGGAGASGATAGSPSSGSGGANVSGGTAGTAAGGIAGTGGTAAGGTAGTGGSAGLDPACPDLAIDERPGIVITAHGETIEFRDDLLWYGGRPPTLDLSAQTNAAGWASFRLFIAPDSGFGTTGIVPGVYRSRPGNTTYVSAHTDSGILDTVENDASIICVAEAGMESGARVSGTFSATLAGADGTTSIPVTGTFFGTIGE
jgi:hypothetical protein